MYKSERIRLRLQDPSPRIALPWKPGPPRIPSQTRQTSMEVPSCGCRADCDVVVVACLTGVTWFGPIKSILILSGVARSCFCTPCCASQRLAHRIGLMSEGWTDCVLQEWAKGAMTLICTTCGSIPRLRGATLVWFQACSSSQHRTYGWPSCKASRAY